MPSNEDERLFHERRQALEEAFFRKQDEALIARLRARQSAQAMKETLARVSGISNDTVLEKLSQLGLTAETLPAVTLIPLIAVAWADGSIDAREREAVLTAADGAGVKQGDPGYAMLESWLSRTPEPALIRQWEDYVRTLAAALTPAEKVTLKNDVIGRARSVAEATGGILGFGSKISAAEERTLDRLSQAFGD